MKKINIGFIAAVILIFSVFVRAEENKNEDEVVVYLKEISSIITNVDITVRNVGMNYLPMQEAVKRMDTYVAQLESTKYPEVLAIKHKMIVLSFKKIRMGLLLFSPENKELSIKVIKSGTNILKYVAKEIVKIADEKGLLVKKEKEQDVEKGESK